MCLYCLCPQLGWICHGAPWTGLWQWAHSRIFTFVCWSKWHRASAPSLSVFCGTHCSQHLLSFLLLPRGTDNSNECELITTIMTYFNKSLKQTMVVLQQLPSQCWVELILQQLIGLLEEQITCHEWLALCLLTHSVLYPFSTVAALPWFIFCFHPGSITDLLIDHGRCSKRLQYSAGLNWIPWHCVPVYCFKGFGCYLCLSALFL